MGSFGKYFTDDILRGDSTGVTYLDHRDPPPKWKEGYRGIGLVEVI